MDGRIFHILELVDADITREWTINELSSTANLSVPHFQRLFKQNTGHPAMKYIRIVRITLAKTLLETTFLQVKEVAVKVGFSNTRRFSSEFREVVGLLPLKYRKKFWIEKQLEAQNETSKRQMIFSGSN